MQNRFFSVLTRILVLGKFFFAILLSHAIPTLISKVQAQPTISGRIANARTGFGILSVDLDVFDESGNSVSITGGRSGTDGLYTITLPGAGRYIVRADPSVSDFFVDQYFNGVFLPRQATVLEVGSTTTRTGVDFRLDTGYLIRGTVRSGGTPLAGVDLDLFSSTG